MTTKPTTVKLTYDDYVSFPDDGNRHELIDGEHFVTPAPLTKHQRIALNLATALHSHCQHTKQDRTFIAPTDVILSKTDVVQPDLLFIKSDRAQIITPENIQGPPDLVVEILSDATRQRDEGLKRTLYEQQGVTEYWIVDPELHSVKRYQLHKHRYGTPDQLTLDQSQPILTTPLLPGFSMLLADLFG